MKPQNFQLRDNEVIEKFVEFRQNNPKVERKLNLSWSNWGFGIEPFEQSIARLAKFNVKFIELHNNNEFDEIVRNVILPIRKILASSKRIIRANRNYIRSNRLTGFERYLANKRSKKRRF